jgi:hypothetical protein
VLREVARGTRLSRAQALKTFFLFLELRHRVEIHQMTGRVVECPIDEMNRPRGRAQSRLRIPPSAEQVDRLFAGWRQELASCRKFAPSARNYTACRLMARSGCGSTRRVSSIWATSSESWADSASCTSVMARAPGVPGLVSAWCH